MDGKVQLRSALWCAAMGSILSHAASYHTHSSSAGAHCDVCVGMRARVHEVACSSGVSRCSCFSCFSCFSSLHLATDHAAVLELLIRARVHAPHLREASAAILAAHGICDIDRIGSYRQLGDLRHEGRRLALRVVNKLWRLKNATSGESLWFCACVSAAHCTRPSCRFSCKHPRVCGTRLRCVVCRCVVPT